MRGRPIILLVAACVALGGCAVTPLKAPCSRDEGQPSPLSFAQVTTPSPTLGAFDGLRDVECGLMKPVNSQ